MTQFKRKMNSPNQDKFHKDVRINTQDNKVNNEAVFKKQIQF